MDRIPWDIIGTIVCAVLGSQGLWQWIEHKSGRFERLESAIKRIEAQIMADKADRWRSDILRFDAELRHKERHTYEEWEQIIDTVDLYEKYCTANEGTYTNTKAESAKRNVREKYETCKNERDFL